MTTMPNIMKDNSMKLRIVALCALILIAGTLQIDARDPPRPPPPSKPPAPVVRIGDPIPGLSATDLARFLAGKAVFSRVFTAGDGLGPLFNNAGCAACHEVPVVGGSGGFGEEGEVDVERHASAGDQPTCNELVNEGGPVFRQQTTGVPIPPIPAGSDVHIGGRSTPALFSSGSIDAVWAANIVENEKNGGRAARLPDGSIGRFGRKATDANLADFVRGAFAIEQGVDVPSELSEADLALATFFVRNLAPPATQVKDRKGETLFKEIGCAHCHIPSMHIGGGHRAFIYSDLLLHDMGPGLADICKGAAATHEFRTEPLMGIRFRTRFLHDGRALTLTSAIANHGGNAQRSSDKFFNLHRDERQALLKFLGGL